AALSSEPAAEHRGPRRGHQLRQPWARALAPHGGHAAGGIDRGWRLRGAQRARGRQLAALRQLGALTATRRPTIRGIPRPVRSSIAVLLALCGLTLTGCPW